MLTAWLRLPVEDTSDRAFPAPLAGFCRRTAALAGRHFLCCGGLELRVRGGVDAIRVSTVIEECKKVRSALVKDTWHRVSGRSWL